MGVLEATRAGSVTPDTAGASETMFRAVSAAVIGGTLLIGGVGTAIGALFGALFLGVLRDGLTLEGVNADYLDFILGLAILGAMVINIYVGRVRKGSGVADASPRTSCASRTSPSASAPSRRCATSTCTWARARCSGCWATTARASRR